MGVVHKFTQRTIHMQDILEGKKLEDMHDVQIMDMIIRFDIAWQT